MGNRSSIYEFDSFIFVEKKIDILMTEYSKLYLQNSVLAELLRMTWGNEVKFFTYVKKLGLFIM